MSTLRTLICFAFALIVVGAVRSQITRSADRQISERFALNEEPEEIARVLSWYMRHSLGSLDPRNRIELELPAAAEQFQNGLMFDILRGRGVFYLGEISPAGTSDPWYRIGKKFLNHVWWSGRPAGKRQFSFSPYVYELVAVDKITPRSNRRVRMLEVEFRWKTIEVSPLAEIFEAETSLKDLQRERKGDELSLGTIENHSVQMKYSRYGYFLPLLGELQFRNYVD